MKEIEERDGREIRKEAGTGGKQPLPPHRRQKDDFTFLQLINRIVSYLFHYKVFRNIDLKQYAIFINFKFRHYLCVPLP